MGKKISEMTKVTTPAGSSLIPMVSDNGTQATTIDNAVLNSTPVKDIKASLSDINGTQLYNPNTDTTSSVINSSGAVISTSSNWRATDYIGIGNFKNIILENVATSSGNGSACVAFYDTNKAFIQSSATVYSLSDNRYIKISVPTNAVYMRASVYNSLNKVAKIYGVGEQTTITEQVGTIKEDLSDNLGKSYKIDDFIQGKWLNTNVAVGGTVDLTAITSQSGLCYKIIDVVPNTTIYLSGKGGSGPRLYCFIDSNNKVIEVAAQGLAYKGYLTVPANANRVIVNSLIDDFEIFISDGIVHNEIGKIKDTLEELKKPTVNVLGSAFTNTSYANMTIDNITNYRELTLVLRNSAGSIVSSTTLPISIFKEYCTAYTKALSTYFGESNRVAAYYVNNTTLQVVSSANYSGIIYGIK